MTDPNLLKRLLNLAELAVDEALQLEYGDPEDRYIYRELQELKLLVQQALERLKPVKPTAMEIIALSVEIEEEGLGEVDLVRRALQRWGTTTTDTPDCRMKDTSFRTLCAELLDALCNYETAAIDATLADRARIALAEAYEVEANNPPEGHPDPEPFQAILRERAAALQPEPVGLRPSDDDIYGLFDWLKDEWHSNNESEFPLPEFARAVLARWGAPPPSAT